jgi:hypothetical protein
MHEEARRGKKHRAKPAKKSRSEGAPAQESASAFTVLEHDVSDQVLSDNAAAQILNQMTRNVNGDGIEPPADPADHINDTTQDSRLSDELVVNPIKEISLNAERGSIIAQPSVNFDQDQSQKNFADFNLDIMITDTYSAPTVPAIFFDGEYMDFNIDDMLRQLPRAESEASPAHQSDAADSGNNIAEYNLDAMPSLCVSSEEITTALC